MDIKEMYEEYFSDVYKYMVAISHNTHVAEEITQETFFKALKKADQFRGQCQLRVWLCQIAKNTYLDYLRKNKKYVPEVEREEVEPLSPDLAERFADRETAYRIHQLLHGLEEPYKEVFSLRIFGELSFGMIASLFGKSESWARVTYHRACKKIREELYYEDQL